jgi:hypothetical protein
MIQKGWGVKGLGRTLYEVEIVHEADPIISKNSAEWADLRRF